MQIIKEALNQVTRGADISFKNLHVTPLIAENGDEPDYLTLDEALARDAVHVKEVSEQGSVPELTLENKGDLPILLLDGEELVGAKQNRVLNLTILVPAKATVTIPVSCVEAMRWSDVSPEFSTMGRAMYASGRALKADHVTNSMRSEGMHRSRQDEVWADIAAKSQRLHSRSPTGAMADLFEDYQDRVERYLNAVQVLEHQVGAVFSINGQVRGLELFDNPTTLSKLMPKLVRSYALDAIDEGTEGATATRAPDARHFLESVMAADESVHPALGEGEDIRFSSPGLAGAALKVKDRILHLCAFALSDTARHEGAHQPRMARPSRRARRYSSSG